MNTYNVKSRSLDKEMGMLDAVENIAIGVMGDLGTNNKLLNLALESDRAKHILQYGGNCQERVESGMDLYKGIVELKKVIMEANNISVINDFVLPVEEQVVSYLMKLGVNVDSIVDKNCGGLVNLMNKKSCNFVRNN